MAEFSGFKPLGSPPKKPAQPDSKPRGVKTGIPKSLNYNKIEADVMAAIGQLSTDKQAQIPLMGTLPERMVGLALVWLGYIFQCQRPEDGGRLRIGGSVVDFIVYVGGHKVVLRANGDYWHSLPDRKRSDAMQAERLRARGYRVSDLWESKIYEAWVQGGLEQFVEQAVLNAT